MEIPSPVLIIGDQYLSKNNINALKNKYESCFSWVLISASENTIEAILSEAGMDNFISQPKIIVIHDLPNQKIFRESIIDLCSKPSDNKFIVWDSTNTIKLDPKTKQPNKTWGDFIDKFKSIKGSKFVNNGAEFTEKDSDDCISLVKTHFAKYKKNIGIEEAKLLIKIVGIDRGMLISEVEKLALDSPYEITANYIYENTFPTSKEAVLYKFGNALDGAYGQAILVLESFLDSGMNENVLAEIIAKKARWQLAACHLYSKGMGWYDVDKELLNMGKFPSCVWHNDRFDYSQKQKISQSIETEEGIEKFKQKELGLPDYYFGEVKKKKIKKKKGEKIEEEEEEVTKESGVSLGKKEMLPMPFMASQITSALQSTLVKPNDKMEPKELRVKLLDRALNVYLQVVDKLKDVRYGIDPKADLFDMVRIMMDRTI